MRFEVFIAVKVYFVIFFVTNRVTMQVVTSVSGVPAASLLRLPKSLFNSVIGTNPMPV
jgi:hypothetical protein